MRIALINENSQASKNGLIYAALKEAVEPLGHEVDNYGMYSDTDAEWLTYVQNGILAAVLLNSGAADYVVTGCGTGEGALLALNSFPGVLCGHIVDPADAFLFSQINDGNAVSIPFAKGFGWGADLNLRYMFEKLFLGESGNGYPPEKQVPQRQNRQILNEVRANNLKDLVTCLEGLDPALVKGALGGKHFKELFYAHAKEGAVRDYVQSIVGA
jgi:ribose 5-phosphate isomerase RpiB